MIIKSCDDGMKQHFLLLLVEEIGKETRTRMSGFDGEERRKRTTDSCINDPHLDIIQQVTR